MRTHSSRYYYRLLLLTSFLWGSAYPVVRWLALSGLDGLLVAGVRLLFTFLFAIVLLIVSRQKLDIPALKAHFFLYVVMGLLGSVGFLFLMALGVQYTEAGKSSLIVGSSPVLIVILSAIFLKEPLTVRKLCSIVIAVCGVFLAVTGAELVQGHTVVFRPADLILLSACVSWAVYSLLYRMYGHLLTYVQVFFWMFVFGSIVTAFLLIPYYPTLGRLTPVQWLWLAYIGILPGGVGYLLWNKCVNVIGASTAGIFNTMMPVFAIVLSTVTLGERMIWLQLVGGAMVLGGIILGITRNRLPVNYETGISLTESNIESNHPDEE